MTLQRGQNSKLGTDVRSENYRTRRQAGSTLQFRDRQPTPMQILRVCSGAKESCFLVHRYTSLITSDFGSQNISRLNELITGIS